LKRLYLLRHAKSSWDDMSLADHDRPLSQRGSKAAQRIGVHMRKAKIHPALVLCSSAARAVQTYEAVAPALGDGIGLRIEDDLYGASSAQLLGRLHGLPETAESVLLIGHNPGLQDLALELAGDGDSALMAEVGDKFPTGALASLSVPVPWAMLARGEAVLVSVVVPRSVAGH
jgi:phosphohistidine phosphatase